MRKRPVASVTRAGYSIEEAALDGRAGARSSVYKLVKSGELESYLVNGRRIIPVAALDRLEARLLKANEAQPVDPKISEAKSRAGHKGRASQLGKEPEMA